jgi:hypothetical protein
MTGVVTGHFEDKTIVAYYRSEAAIARLFIRVQYRIRSALERLACRTQGCDAEIGDWAMGLFDNIGRDPDRNPCWPSPLWVLVWRAI